MATETQKQNRIAWLEMLKDPANQHRKTNTLLGDGDKCCVLGLWVREKHPELVHGFDTGDYDPEERDPMEKMYQITFDDLGIRGYGAEAWKLNDDGNYTFAKIADLLPERVFALADKSQS